MALFGLARGHGPRVARWTALLVGTIVVIVALMVLGLMLSMHLAPDDDDDGDDIFLIMMLLTYVVHYLLLLALLGSFAWVLFTRNIPASLPYFVHTLCLEMC